MTEDRTAEIGGRIALARKGAGVTQDALAELLGLDKTSVSKIEHGRRRVDGFELSVIAERLGTTVRELLGISNRRSMMAIAARLGSAESPPGIAIRRARELIELDALADELDVPSSANPIRPVGLPQGGGPVAQGAALAKSLRSDLQIGEEGLADLVGISERDFGVDVASEPFGDGPSGLLVHAADDIVLALLNADDVPARQRFTLAHELGHHLFADPAEVILEDGVGTDAGMERRADAFATEFLMPEGGLRRLIGSGPVTDALFVDALVRFGVSREAMVNRLRRLRLISEDDRRRLLDVTVRSLFVASGRAADYETWTAGKGVRRVPARIERRLLEAYRQGRIGIGPVASLAGRDPDDLRDELADIGIAPKFEEHDFAIDLI